MHLDELLEGFGALEGSAGWITQVFLVVFAVLLFNFFLRRLLDRVHRRFERTENPWDDALIDALRRPASLLVWIAGIAFAAEIVRGTTGAAIFGAVGPLRDIGIIATITWFLLRLIRRVEYNLIERHEAAGLTVDRSTTQAISKLLRVSVMITSVLVALQTLGFSISGVLAFGGVGGVAVGFAAKDLLANFFGALMIYLDRPFGAGDWIYSKDREIEGTVEEVGWRLTRIRSFDKRPIYVPNSLFATIGVVNASRMSHRRIYETIGVRYDDAAKVRDIVAEVKRMLVEHPDIDHTQTLMVNFNAFGPSSLDFFVYTFTRTTVWTEYHEVKQDVLLRVHDIIAAHGAEVAFPTTTVHVPDGVRLEAALPMETGKGPS